MVSRERIQLGVQVNAGGVDEYPCAGGIQHFHIRMNLRDGDGQRGAVVYHRMLTKENNLAGRGRECVHRR